VITEQERQQRIRDRLVRRDERRRILRLLTRSAYAPEKIGRRCILLDFALNGGQKGKQVADRLGVSPSFVSKAIATLTAELEDTKG
jgi:hypothetical protein